MTIGTRYTFWGLCRQAISFYCEVFHFEIEKLVTYGECGDLGIPLQQEHNELVQSAVLLHSCGCRLYMCDSFTLLLSQDPIEDINKGHLSERGCRCGSAFEVHNLGEDELTAIYKQLIENQSIVHTPLGARGDIKLYANVMDKFNLSWELSCE